MCVQVHILGPQFSTFVRAVMLCCEEKGIAYSYGYEIEGKDVKLHDEEHLKLHPFGKFPVLIHGDRTLYETATICRYLDAEFEGPALQPSDNYVRALVDQWSSVISLYIDKAIVRQYLLELAFPKGDNGEIRWDKVSKAQPSVLNMLQILETQLGDKSFICGEDYTIADALVSPMIDYIANLPNSSELIEPDSKLGGYIERVRKRVSGQKVLVRHSSR